MKMLRLSPSVLVDPKEIAAIISRARQGQEYKVVLKSGQELIVNTDYAPDALYYNEACRQWQDGLH